jgi:hypothetical protein
MISRIDQNSSVSSLPANSNGYKPNQPLNTKIHGFLILIVPQLGQQSSRGRGASSPLAGGGL